MTFVSKRSLAIINTKIQKQKTITHKPFGTVGTNDNWDYYNFDQSDYMLTRNRWTNAFINAESDVYSKIDSDHYIVWAGIRIRLKKPKSKGKHDSNRKELKATNQAQILFTINLRSTLRKVISLAHLLLRKLTRLL